MSGSTDEPRDPRPALRASIRVNNDLSIAEAIELARAAEDAGFDQLWYSHDLFLRSAPVVLAQVALHTEHIGLGIGILNPYSQDPAEIAMTAATMQEACGGRFLLGLAPGAREFLDWIGLPQEKPLTRIRETIDVVRRLLAGKRATLAGQSLRWNEGAYLRSPSPAPVPIYLGAMGPKMLELAGELADGVLPLLFPPEHYYAVRPLVARGERRRRPGLATLDFAACFWVSIGEDGQRARRALAEKVAVFGPSLGPLILEQLGVERSELEAIEHAVVQQRDLDRAVTLIGDALLSIGIAGSAEDVLQRLLPLVRAGADHVSFGPPLGPDRIAAVEALGRDVLPFLRTAALGRKSR